MTSLHEQPVGYVRCTPTTPPTWIDGVAQWTPNPLVVENVGSVKYLGLEIDIDGSGKTQFALSRRVARVTTSVISSRIALLLLNTRLHAPQRWRNFCTL